MNVESEKKLRRVKISRDAFHQADRFIAAARSHPIDTIEHEALLLAAIIYYAQPFSGNEKGKPDELPSDASLDREFVDLDDPDDLALHDRIIRLRHKAVAHAEFSHNPMHLVLAPPESSDQRPSALVSRQWHVVMEQIDLERFQRIAKHLATSCWWAMHALFVHG
jgi:hypothetical protein